MATLTVLAFEKDKREENLFGNDLTNAAEYIYFNCLRHRMILQRAILPGRPEADRHIQRIITATKLVRKNKPDMESDSGSDVPHHPLVGGQT